MKASSRHFWWVGALLGLQSLTAPLLLAQTPPAKNAPPVQMPPAVRQAAEQFDKAIKFQRERKLPQAISAYIEYIRLAKIAKVATNALIPAYVNLATLYGAQNSIKEQTETLHELTKLAPNNAGILADVANLDISQGRFEEAKSEAEQVLKMKPAPTFAAAAHFTLGIYYLQKNELPKAQQEFLQTTKLAPNNAQAFMNLAISYARDKKIPQAIAAAENARRVAPKLLQAYVFLGNFYRESGNIPKAAQALDGAVAIEPKIPNLQFERALLHQQIGDFTIALKGYLSVLELEPNNASARLNAGQLYFGLQNPVAAKIQYQAAEKLLPKDARPLVGIALCDIQLAQAESSYPKRLQVFRQVEEVLNRANTLAPNSPLVQDSLLLLHERANHFPEAEKLVQKRLDKEPDDPKNYYTMARILRAQRQMDAIITLWKKYRTRKPDDKASYAEAADAYELSGRAKEGVKEWDIYLQRKPKDVHAHLQKARMLVSLQQLDEGRKEYQTALTLEPETPKTLNERSLVGIQRVQAYRGLADICRQQQKHEEGVGYLVKAKAIDLASSKTFSVPPSTDLLAELASMYALAGKNAEAIREYDDLALYPGREISALQEMARLCDLVNDVDRARNAYRRAALRSKDPVAQLLQVGTLYRKRQQFSKEVEEYRALLEKYPKDPRVYSALASTYELLQQDEKAADTYRAALALDPKAIGNPTLRGHLATVYVRLKKFEAARAIYEQLIKTQPTQAQHYADLGQIYVQENQRSAFLAWLQRKLEATPSDEVLFNYHYEEMERQKGAEATLKYLDDLSAKHKTDRKLQEAYANALLSHFRAAKALVILQTLADTYPNDLNAQVNLVEALDKSGKQADATKHLIKITERKEIPADVLLGFKRQLGMRYLDAKQPELAFPYLFAVAKGARNDFQAVVIVADMLAKDGRDEEMLPIYGNILTLKGQPNSLYAEVHKRMARIHAKKGRKADAIGHFKEALRINPEDNTAKQEMKVLEGK